MDSLHLEHGGRDALLAESGDDVDDEEGGPAEQEDAHDDADGDRRLVLLQQGRVAGRNFDFLKLE